MYQNSKMYPCFQISCNEIQTFNKNDLYGFSRIFLILSNTAIELASNKIKLLPMTINFCYVYPSAGEDARNFEIVTIYFFFRIDDQGHVVGVKEREGALQPRVF